MCWVFTAAGFSLVVAVGSCSLVVICWLLTAVSSLVAEHRLQGLGASVVVAHGLGNYGSRAPEHRLDSYGIWA